MDVSDGEYSRCRRLERQRRSLGEDRVAKGGIRNRTIGEDEPLLIEGHRALEPRCGGFRPDEAEESDASVCAVTSRRRVLQIDGFQVVTTLKGPDLGLGEHLNVGIGRNAIDEVLRHASRQIGSANRDRDAASPLAEVDGRLSSRIPATHDDDLRTAA